MIWTSLGIVSVYDGLSASRSGRVLGASHADRVSMYCVWRAVRGAEF